VFGGGSEVLTVDLNLFGEG